MSTITATIQKVQNLHNLHIVTFVAGSKELTMMSLELSQELHKNTKVTLQVKSTAVGIGKKVENALLSYENQLPCTVVSLDRGKLLCSVELDFEGFRFEAIITAKVQEKLSLRENEQVTAFIKASDFSIVGVLQ